MVLWCEETHEKGSTHMIKVKLGNNQREECERDKQM